MPNEVLMMMNANLKKVLLVAVNAILALVICNSSAFALSKITSATLNGARSVTVASGAKITAVVKTQITQSSTWGSTAWRIATKKGMYTACVNHANHTTKGTYQESFDMVAPASAGVYNAYFHAFGSDNCIDKPGGTLAMNQAVTVSSKSFTVTPSAGPHGGIAPSAPQTVNYGATTSFTVTPDTGYHIASVKGCGGLLSGNTYTTGPVTANCKVSASFAIDTFTVTPSAGPHGGIAPSAPQTVNYGTATSFTVMPDTGYHIASVTGCGGSLSGSTYTTAPVTANCTVSAAFAIDTFTVTPSAGTHGSISPSAPQTVDYQATTAFTITPDPGYLIASAAGCGGSLSGSTFTTGPVTANCTVSAAFALSVRTVCPSGCDYTSVQTAITNSNPGEFIKIAQGIYRENVLVNASRDFTLSGGWDSSFTLPASDPLLTVLDGDVNQDGIGDSSTFTFDATSGVIISANVQNITIMNGYASEGGGVNVYSSGSGTINLTLSKDIITGNAAGSGGGISARALSGGQSQVLLENTMIVENSATDGGGIYVRASDTSSSSGITLLNTTVTANTGDTGGGLSAASSSSGTASVSAKNVILWGNSAVTGSDAYLLDNASTTAFSTTFSDIGTVAANGINYAPGTGDISNDPVFVNPALFNYRLNSDSSCKDTGTVTGAPTDDFEGDGRPQGEADDMGADEYLVSASSSLKLLSLNGGEVIPSGKPYDITWTAPVSMVKFKVRLSLDDGLTWSTLTTTGNVRHYRWELPRFTGNKRKCMIRVIGYDASNTKVGVDVSDMPFTAEVVRLTSPNGGPGQVFVSGTSYPITWETPGTTKNEIAEVRLYYTVDGGLNWRLIDRLSGNIGRYDNWTPVVNMTSAACKVKIVLKDINGITMGSDKSDTTFTIRTP